MDLRGPAKNRLHDYESGWLTFLVNMGVATRQQARDAIGRLAQQAIDDMEARRERRRQERKRHRDRLVETDSEHIQALFPRLAAAAERQDIDTILASLDPEVRPLRADAERVLNAVRPTEVTITNLDINVDSKKSPPAATADMIVRVSGNVVGDGTSGTVLVGLRVSLVKKGETWLVTDADVEPRRSGR
jgi:hypothetical protein